MGWKRQKIKDSIDQFHRPNQDAWYNLNIHVNLGLQLGLEHSETAHLDLYQHSGAQAKRVC